jgi:hypothetical protein
MNKKQDIPIASTKFGLVCAVLSFGYGLFFKTEYVTCLKDIYNFDKNDGVNQHSFIKGCIYQHPSRDIIINEFNEPHIIHWWFKITHFLPIISK